MQAVDCATLVIILLASLHLGFVGLFDLDLLTIAAGHYAGVAQIAVGLAALWQAKRQRFR
jgi:uncharacterized membrane protein YuzA (DUF378 family)